MIRYISQDEVEQFLVVPKNKTEFLFNQVTILRGFIQDDDVPKIKLSDLVEIQFYFLREVQITRLTKDISESTLFEAALISNKIFDDGLDLWQIVNGTWYCPKCGSKRFDGNCKACRERYDLPQNAKRIELTADNVYPALSLGYLIELMPISESGSEFRLAKVKIDGYKNTGFVYFKNIRMID